ncbi:hypothetical protein P3T76_000351 [Phytophthora citrophthora]|uniref:Uncharacterized protein n=1 Tax=Phytophthora citrophthora TaxID=4793 RepID=A0AAD9H1V1_9STRA|nr:hypothetical protein P3T76_000351 [Phytophthora citrophthora]
MSRALLPALLKRESKKLTAKGKKRDALTIVERVGVYRAAQKLNYPRRTVGDWWKQQDSIFAFAGSAKSKTLKGQGRKENIPFFSVLVTFMKDQRRQELRLRKFLTTSLLMELMRDNFNEWLDDYYVNKKNKISGTQVFQRLCQRFMHRFVIFISFGQRVLLTGPMRFTTSTKLPFTKRCSPGAHGPSVMVARELSGLAEELTAFNFSGFLKATSTPFKSMRGWITMCGSSTLQSFSSMRLRRAKDNSSRNLRYTVPFVPQIASRFVNLWNSMRDCNKKSVMRRPNNSSGVVSSIHGCYT